MISRAKKDAPGQGGANTERTRPVYRPSHAQSTSADPILHAARAIEARVLRELGLLAVIAPLGGRGMMLADRAGVRAEHFIGDDTNIIYIALQAAMDTGAIPDGERTARMIREALRHAHLWDEADTRPAGHALRWGPARLARLMHWLTADHAEEALPALASEMIGGAQ